MKKFFILLTLATLSSAQAQAKIFANQFIEFELPDKWECALDGTEWVCQSTDEQKKRDAIIVLAAKIKKPGMDDLPIYKAHLEKPQQYQSLSGEAITSEPKYVKETNIRDHIWIDSLHLQSEIPDFYTRYLATVEADLGILVTFSVRKDKYDEYLPDIDNMVKSMRAFRKEGPLDKRNDEPEVDPTSLFTQTGTTTKKRLGGPAEDAGMGILLLLLVGAGIGFFLWKKKQKK